MISIATFRLPANRSLIIFVMAMLILSASDKMTAVFTGSHSLLQAVKLLSTDTGLRYFYRQIDFFPFRLCHFFYVSH